MNWIEIAYLVGGVVFGLIGKNAYSFIAAFSAKGSKVSVQLSEAFAASAETFNAIDVAIKNDEKIDGNELKDIIAKGKDAMIEFKDVIVEIKKK